MTIGSLEYIRWLDACGEPDQEWMALSDLDCPLQECESVGWLGDETPTWVTLVQNIHRELGEDDDDPRVAGVITIPKALILSRTILSTGETNAQYSDMAFDVVHDTATDGPLQVNDRTVAPRC